MLWNDSIPYKVSCMLDVIQSLFTSVRTADGVNLVPNLVELEWASILVLQFRRHYDLF